MKPVVIMLAFMLSGCQSAYLLKPEQLPHVSARSYTLKDSNEKPLVVSDIYQYHKGTVLLFWQLSCPCVKRYQKRIDMLYNQYSDKGIAFAYISSNSEPFSEVKKEYIKRGIALSLLRDEGAELAHALRVKGTPTAVLLDQQGAVRFMGWIDNEHDVGETGRKAYLENALREFVAGQAITTPTSPMFGCPIR